MSSNPFRGKPVRLVAAVGGLALLAGVTLVAAPGATAAAAPHKYDHVVVLVEENHSYRDIIGDTQDAPYLNGLAKQGALFSNSFAIEHPSQPNYLDLFSGGNQGVPDDSCPSGPFSASNQASELLAAKLTFDSYSEGLPSDGATDCTAGKYAAKHAPWTTFDNVPAANQKTFAEFPSDYSKLPTVSWVIPNLDNDMHDGSIKAGDDWLQQNIDGYAQWAKNNNSLLIVTWDEDDNSQSNQIPTIFAGAAVKPGTYNEKVDHFSVLRTIEDMYGLPATGAAANSSPVTDVFAS